MCCLDQLDPRTPAGPPGRLRGTFLPQQDPHKAVPVTARTVRPLWGTPRRPPMAELATALILLGLLYLAALAADIIGRRSHLPRVTILLLAGVVAGPSVLDLVPQLRESAFDIITIVALTFVGFSLGNSFTLDWLRENGKAVMIISVTVVAITATVVFAGLVWYQTAPLVVAILLAGVATATAPAATRDVVQEANATGPFARKLLAIVAVDDAWGVLLFSVLLAVAQGFEGQEGVTDVLLGGAWEIIGAAMLGLALGIPLAWAKDRSKRIENSLAMTLGTALLCTGLAELIHVSFLLATMVLGATVANMARKSDLAFEALERVEWPILTLFFVLAGASLHLDSLIAVGLLGTMYVVLRIVGRVLAGYLGARWAGEGPHMRRWIGPALLPQAGIAIGLGFVAATRFPAHRETIMTVVIGSTVVFELIGPIVARIALKRAGEMQDLPEEF